MKPLVTTLALGLTLLTLNLAGCNGETTSSGPESEPPPPTVDAHAHAHPSEGPHHGDLVELGNEEFHAEIVHDEGTGSVMVYVLDGAATEQVPIESKEVTINTRHDGSPRQFVLTSSPDPGDPEGKSSRFVSDDKELAAHLDDEGAEPRLVLTINGKSYRGEITHSHDHAH